MKKPRTARALAKRLLNDRAYLKNLKQRLRSGTVAAGLEVALWTYAHGKPEPDPPPEPEVLPNPPMQQLARKLMALDDAEFKAALDALVADHRHHQLPATGPAGEDRHDD